MEILCSPSLVSSSLWKEYLHTDRSESNTVVQNKPSRWWTNQLDVTAADCQPGTLVSLCVCLCMCVFLSFAFSESRCVWGGNMCS